MASASRRSVPLRRGRHGAASGRGARPDALLEPGDVIHVGPGEWHFHGGAQDTPMVHVAVNGGGAPEWGEPVTDDEYDEGFA